MEANTAPFVERNPKLNVVSSPATGGAWPDKPLSMFAAGTPPDILSGDVFHFRWQLAEQGARSRPWTPTSASTGSTCKTSIREVLPLGSKGRGSVNKA